ncbi:MAG: hypothetical protein PUC01_00665 [Spirochaetales bacterium]|nr:hypothetical protein [Spirochaetales bacterium]
MKSKVQNSDTWLEQLNERQLRYRYEVLYKAKDSSLPLERVKKLISAFYHDEENIKDLISALNDAEYDLLLSKSLKQDVSIPRNNEKLYDFYLVGDDKGVIPEIERKLNCAKGLYEESEDRINIKSFIRAMFALLASKDVKPTVSGKGVLARLSEIFTSINEEKLSILITHFKEMVEKDELIVDQKLNREKAEKLLKLSQIELAYHLLSPNMSIKEFQVSQLKTSDLSFSLLPLGEKAEYTITGELLVYFQSSIEDDLIWKIAKPITVDRICVYKITKESICSAFDSGYSDQTIINHLKNLGINNSVLFSRLIGWKEEYELTQLTDCLYLETSRQQAAMIEAIDDLKPLIIKKVGTYSFILKRNRKVIEVLKRSGFDMLSQKNVTFESEGEADKELQLERLQEEDILTFGLRDIPYNENYKDELKAISSNELSTLIDNERILTKSQARLKSLNLMLESIWALDYQKKITYLNAMCGIRFLNLKLKDENFVALPLEMNQTFLTCLLKDGTKRQVMVDKIFKVSEIY